MTRLLTILGLLIAVSTFGSPGADVTVHLGTVTVVGTHTNMFFECKVTINNQTGVSLTVTNLFCMSPGLALKIADLEGKELKRTYAWPWKAWKWTVPPGNQQENEKLWYGAKPKHGGGITGISLPDPARIVRLQIEGTLSGSSYAGSITSNVVEVKIP
jgi:hypothetical protein